MGNGTNPETATPSAPASPSSGARRIRPILLAAGVGLSVGAALFVTAGLLAKRGEPTPAQLLDDARANAAGSGLTVRERLGALFGGTSRLGKSAGQLGEELARHGADAVPAVMEGAAQKDPYVREACTTALTRLGPLAVPAMIQALPQADEAGRQLIFRVLGQAGPDSERALRTAIGQGPTPVRRALVAHVPPGHRAEDIILSAGLRDGDASVRRNALARLGSRPLWAEWLSDLDDLGREAVPLVLRALRSTDPAVRSAGEAALRKLGPDAAPVLATSLEDNADTDRPIISALWGMGKSGLDALSKRLATGDPPLRRLIISTVPSDHPGAMAILQRGLADADSQVKRQALRGLSGRVKLPADLMDKLTGLIDDPDADVRRQAASAILRVHPSSAVPLATIAALLSPKQDPGMLAAVVDWLIAHGMNRKGVGKVFDKALALPYTEFSTILCQKLWSQKHKARPAVGALLRAYARPELKFKRFVSRALSDIGLGKSDIPAAIEVLNVDDESTRLDMVRLLERAGPLARPAAPALAALMNRAKSPELKQAIARAMRQMGAAPSVSVAAPSVSVVALARTLDSDNVDTVRETLLAMAKLQERARPAASAVIRVLKRPDVAYLAIHALLAMGAMPREGLSPLPDEDQQAMAVGIASLIEARKTRNLGSAVARLPSLGKNLLSAIPTLAKLQSRPNDPYVWGAWRALASLGEAAAKITPILIGCLRTGESATRQRCVDLLGHIGPQAAAALPLLWKELTRQSTGRVNQRSVIESLAKIDPECKQSAPKLKAMLASGEPAQPVIAAGVLAKMKSVPHELVPSLLSLLQGTTDRNALAQVMAALGSAGPAAAKAVPALQRHVLDKRNPNARNAARALRRIGPAAKPVVAALIAALRVRQRGDTAYLLALSELAPISPDETFPVLRKALKERRGASYAAYGLGELGTRAKPALDDLRQALASPGVLVRQSAIAAMAKIAPNDENVRKSIVDIAGQADQASETALSIARDLKMPFSVIGPSLTKCLLSTRHYLQLRASEVAMRFGPEAKALAPALVTCRINSSSTTADNCAQALASIGWQHAVPAYVKALNSSDRKTRYRAMGHMRIMGPAAEPFVPHIMLRLQKTTGSERDSVFSLLTALGPYAKAATPALIEMLDTGTIGQKARVAKVLAEVGAPAKAALPKLRSLLDSPRARDISVAIQKIEAAE